MGDNKLPAGMGDNKLPSGWYIISDPCYIIPDQEWMSFLVETDMLNNRRINNQYTWSGFQLYVSSTEHGDGEYYDQHMGVYGVDAGLIACLPLELADHFGIEYDADSPDGELVEFKEPFTCEYREKGGVIVIGHIEIPTGYVEDDEDEYVSNTEWHEERLRRMQEIYNKTLGRS